MNKPEHTTVKSTFVEYKSYADDKHAFVIVTGWSNGEGVTVDLDEHGCVSLFGMTWQQWDALKKAMKAHLKD